MSHPELKDEERTRCEVYTRVMGYHRPTWCFNPGKLSEYEERVEFEEKVALRDMSPALSSTGLS